MCPAYDGPVLNLREFEGLRSHMRTLSEDRSGSDSVRPGVRDSGYDCWDSEQSQSLSPRQHTRDNSLDSLDSFGSRSQTSPSPDVMIHGNSDVDSDGDAPNRKADVRRDDMLARRTSAGESRTFVPFNQFLPNRNVSAYVPTARRRSRPQDGEHGSLPQPILEEGRGGEGGGPFKRPPGPRSRNAKTVTWAPDGEGPKEEEGGLGQEEEVLKREVEEHRRLQRLEKAGIKVLPAVIRYGRPTPHLEQKEIRSQSPDIILRRNNDFLTNQKAAWDSDSEGEAEGEEGGGGVRRVPDVRRDDLASRRAPRPPAAPRVYQYIPPPACSLRDRELWEDIRRASHTALMDRMELERSAKEAVCDIITRRDNPFLSPASQREEEEEEEEGRGVKVPLPNKTKDDLARRRGQNRPRPSHRDGPMSFVHASITQSDLEKWERLKMSEPSESSPSPVCQACLEKGSGTPDIISLATGSMRGCSKVVTFGGVTELEEQPISSSREGEESQLLRRLLAKATVAMPIIALGFQLSEQQDSHLGGVDASHTQPPKPGPSPLSPEAPPTLLELEARLAQYERREREDEEDGGRDERKVPDLQMDDMMARKTGAFPRTPITTTTTFNRFLPLPGSKRPAQEVVTNRKLQPCRVSLDMPQQHPNVAMVVRPPAPSHCNYGDDDAEEDEEECPVPDLEKDDMLARRTGAYQRSTGGTGRSFNLFLPVPGAAQQKKTPSGGPNQLYKNTPSGGPNQLYKNTPSGGPNQLYKNTPSGGPNQLYKNTPSGGPNQLYQNTPSGGPNQLYQNTPSGGPNQLYQNTPSGGPNQLYRHKQQPSSGVPTATGTEAPPSRTPTRKCLEDNPYLSSPSSPSTPLSSHTLTPPPTPPLPQLSGREKRRKEGMVRGEEIEKEIEMVRGKERGKETEMEREMEKERGREKERGKEREQEREMERGEEKERGREKERGKEIEKEREMERGEETERGRGKEIEKEIEMERGEETERGREKERGKEIEKEREMERGEETERGREKERGKEIEKEIEMERGEETERGREKERGEEIEKERGKKVGESHRRQFWLEDNDLPPMILSRRVSKMSEELESISIINMHSKEEGAGLLQPLGQSRYDGMQKQYTNHQGEEEEWQDDLARWKSRRRSASQDLIRKEEERKRMERMMKEEEGGHTQKKKNIKTYREIVEDKERREAELCDAYRRAGSKEEAAMVLQRYALRFTISDSTLDSLQLPRTITTDQNPESRTPATNQKPESRTPATNQNPESRTPATNQNPESRTPATNQNPESRTTTTNQNPESRTPATNQNPESRTTTTNQYPESRTPATNQNPESRTPATNQNPESRTPATNQNPESRTTTTNQNPESRSPATNQNPESRTPATNQNPEYRTITTDQNPESKIITTDQNLESRTITTDQNPNPRTITNNQNSESRTITTNQNPESRTPATNQNPESRTPATNQNPNPRTITNDQNPESRTISTDQNPKSRTITSDQNTESRTITTNLNPEYRTIITNQNPESRTITTDQNLESRTSHTNQTPESRTHATNQNPNPRTITNNQNSESRTITNDQNPESRTVTTDQNLESRTISTDQNPESRTINADQNSESRTIMTNQNSESRTIIANQNPASRTTTADQNPDSRTTTTDQNPDRAGNGLEARQTDTKQEPRAPKQPQISVTHTKHTHTQQTHTKHTHTQHTQNTHTQNHSTQSQHTLPPPISPPSRPLPLLTAKPYCQPPQTQPGHKPVKVDGLVRVNGETLPSSPPSSPLHSPPPTEHPGANQKTQVSAVGTLIGGRNCVVTTTIVTELTQTHLQPRPLDKLSNTQVNGSMALSRRSGEEAGSDSSLLSNQHTYSSSVTGGLEGSSGTMESPMLNLAKRVDHWVWNPEEERRRQEKWQLEQERFLQEQYLREQEKLKGEWERAQREVDEEERRHNEEEKRILEETATALSHLPPTELPVHTEVIVPAQQIYASWDCESSRGQETSLDCNQPCAVKRSGSYDGPHPPSSSPSSPQPPSPSRCVSGKRQCSGCNQALGKGTAMNIDTLGLYFHLACFKCGVCKVQLGDTSSGTDVRIRNGLLSCHDCYATSHAAGQPTTL
ncbi:daf-12-interacting protein 1-like [Salvelinus fontinalis]|uniref:daf-12-interacting protein 1-like n=1 Tax=Salvelinus fontinalis TaxID=8038 RepID=UPI0024866B9A|nr:daf-12-interacting protein 1-like [Salvelinus fontinalis]